MKPIRFLSPMHNSMSQRRRLLGAALGAGVGATSALSLFPLAVSYAQSTPASLNSDAKLIRIGYQKSAVNLVILKQQGALEKRFPDSKISWIEFPAGPQLLEALSVGSLEFGLTGDSPPVFAQAAGKDLFYVGTEPPKPESSAIIVLKDSPIRSLSDLKGKKIALQKGSSAHFLLVQAVKKSGLKWNDIQPIYLTPADARAAFERKSLDAWVIWDPFYAAIELTVPVRVVSTGAGLTNNNSLYLASRNLVENHPTTIRALFEELTQADQLVQKNREQAVRLISSFSGLSPEVIGLFLKRRQISPVGLLDPQTIADQQAVADAFFELQLIPKKINVADIVWSGHPI